MNSAIFATCLIVFSSVCLGVEPLNQASTSSDQGQDANTVSEVVPVPQDVPSANVTPQLTSEELRAIRKQINESQELSDEVKAKVGEIYDKAIAQLTSVAEFEKKKQQYSQMRKEVPGTLAKIKELLAQQATIVPPEAGPQTTLTQAEQALTAAQLALEEAKKNVTNWESEPKKRAERRTRIPEESNSARQKLDEVGVQLDVPVIQGQAVELAQANRALLLAQQRALESQIAGNTEELLFYDAAGDLLAARRDLTARQLTASEKVVEFWQQKVNDLRQKEAETAKKEAIRAKEETKYPVIQAIAEKNAELAGIQANLAAKIEAVTKYSDVIDANLAAVKSKFEEIRTKVETAGKVTDVLGMVLVAHRDKLPNISGNLRRIKDRASEISLTQFHAMERDKEWSELSNLTDEIEAVFVQLDPSVSEDERESIEKQATNYYESQRKILQAIAVLYGNYRALLANLDTKERQYIETVQEYTDFIEANIFWVKSNPPLRLSDLHTTVSAINWLLSWDNWREAAGFLWTDFKNNTTVYLAIFLVIVLLIVFHPKAHRAIMVLSEQVHKVHTDSFVHTLKALGLTAFLAVAWPIVLFLFQWRLSTTASNHDFSQAIASGFAGLIPVVFMLCFLRHFAMPNGLAQDHLRMRQEPLSFFRRLLGWYFALAIPLIMIIRVMHVQQTNEEWYNSAGRLFFIVHLIILALLQLLLLRPTGPLMEPFLKQKQGGWLEHLRYLWYPLCFILPVTFAVLAGIGYFYAARNLFVKLVVTLLLVLLTILVRALFFRWLMVAQRRLALLERQKREAAEQEVQVQGESADTAESQQSRSKDDGATIFQISRQTRRLINAVTMLIPLSGIWYVWKDVLPALGALADIELWRLGDVQAVTLGSLAMALLIVALTIIATRNAPGLLEIVILRRLPFDRGVRFAIITIFRYSLAVIGIVLAFSEIGIGWSKVQWLIAAMTVGLGFGLQEIFANFVSGLIILFEQPIRVDDVVTIGDVTGNVEKIRIRATTIRRWDKRELVVPNKEFITGHLINWTLSDNVLRREFVVGIAYGSDIVKAEKILYEVARANPLVLEDPAPVVLFTSFGNSSLEFELRVYIAGIDNYIPVGHSINCAIDTEFRKAGIEIAFPQHDIHIRSIDATIPIHTSPSSPKHAEPK